MKRPSSPTIEPLEARIAPAITIAHPIFDIKAGVGQTGITIDLGKLVDASSSYRTIVEFVTNFTVPGASTPGVIRLELFDDKTPLTVQNFLSYVNNLDTANDYEGTYFHRLVNGFVLQGGGYNPVPTVNNFGPHIDTPFMVHNEFVGDDAELDPAVGTIAMAKVGTTQGGGPNSATSEFFINYADNSGILDTQNGGFTVFGKVVQGMDVVNALAALRKVPLNNLSGSGSEGIPTTAASGVPTEAQLIKIVEAHVVNPTAGNASGYTFSADVLDNVTGLQSSVVTQTIDANNQLHLTYKNGKAGVAKVQVTVSKDGETSVVDEFIVNVLPNLVASVQQDLGSVVVPGQKGAVNVDITNNAAGIAKGDIKVRLFLSEATSLNSDIESGFTLEETGTSADIEITADAGKSIALASGKTLSLPVKYEISPEDSQKLKADATYRLLAKIESPDGATSIQELFTDDNVGNIANIHTFKNSFGTLDAKRSGVAITLAEIDVPNVDDAASDALTLIIKGPGLGDVARNADGTMNITITGTTSATTFSIKTASGVTADIDALHITSAIGSIKLGNTFIHSFLSASGGAKSVVLDKLGDGTDSGSLDLGGVTNLKTKVTLGTVRDASFDSTTPISLLTAKEWLNTVASPRETLTFNGLGKLAIKDSFEANLTDLSGSTIASIAAGSIAGSTITTRAALKALTAGNVSDAILTLGDAQQVAALSSSKGTLAFKSVNDTAVTAAFPIASLTALSWTNTTNSAVETLTFQGLGTLKITGDLGANLTENSGLTVKSISVGGAIQSATIHTTGELTALTAGTLTDSTISAGISGVPTVLADLASARNIGSITVKTALSNSNIIASQFGKVSVAGVDGASGSGKFGFYADAIKSYVRAGGPKLSKLTEATVADTVGANYEVRIF